MLAMLPLMLAAAAPTAATLDADRAAHQTILAAHAEGAQVYQCKPAANGALQWSFREPTALLMVDGKTIGRHYAGPHWALDDGSLVQGKMALTVPGASSADVPLLKIDIAVNQGQGALATATLVYRLNTHGGNLTGACTTSGQFQAVAYSADYIFAK